MYVCRTLSWSLLLLLLVCAKILCCAVLFSVMSFIVYMENYYFTAAMWWTGESTGARCHCEQYWGISLSPISNILNVCIYTCIYICMIFMLCRFHIISCSFHSYSNTQLNYTGKCETIFDFGYSQAIRSRSTFLASFRCFFFCSFDGSYRIGFLDRIYIYMWMRNQYVTVYR